MIFLMPFLKNLSQGARLEYIREFRHMTKDEVADYFGFGGEDKSRSISRYENNSRTPHSGKLEEFAKLYNVNINAIKEFDYDNPIDTIYMFMWLEEQFPGYELDIANGRCKGTAYNLNVQNGVRKWEEMRAKKDRKEITNEEYIEWKLHFEIKNEIK